jgi:ABC-type sugar transport system substrate-binding protein
MMRLAFAVIAALGLPLLTPTDANADPKGKKVAFLVTSPTHPFIATLAKTFTAKANSYGMEVNTVSQQFDAALQAQQVMTPSRASLTCLPLSLAPSRRSYRR